MSDPEKIGEFEAVYNRHKAGIYNFCRRMLNDGDDAKDVVQEVFMKFFQSPASFDGEMPVKVWLYRSARNRCLNIIRDNGKLSRMVENEDQIPGTNSPDADIHDESTMIGRVLERLPADYREILILREWDDLSYEEIARALDTTVSAVKSKLFKARKQAGAFYKKLSGD
ncbi:MAG: RNA polymerase sigma factor [Bacteroidetes bacterium]|nr:RNA polymerase sigma factor [Bacteroidota bacterium]